MTNIASGLLTIGVQVTAKAVAGFALLPEMVLLGSVVLICGMVALIGTLLSDGLGHD